MKKESMFTENDIALITPDLNIRRYLNSDIVDEFKLWHCANTNYPNGYGHGTRVHELCITLAASGGGLPIVKVKEKDMLRIRKLTPKECMRLMGFSDEDYESMVEFGLTPTQIYHCAGDSIVVSCIIGIMSQFEEKKDHKKIINDYVESKVIEERK